jgi:hypothetical protein
MTTAYLLDLTPIRQGDNNFAAQAGARLHTWIAGTTTPLVAYTDATATTPLSNPIVADSQGFWPQIWLLNATYDLQARKSDDISVLWSAYNVMAAGALTVSAVSALIANLNNSTDPALGDALVMSKRIMLAGALATTIHNRVEYMPVNAVVDYQVPNDGLTDATPALTAMCAALATAGISADIELPGTYLLRSPASETGEPRSYAAALVIRGLTNCRFRGTGNTKFICDSNGAGAPQFGMIRLEMCTNVEFTEFAADGSGIDIHTIGAARSQFLFYNNHDLDTKADLAFPNRGIHIHHLKLDNFGGGVCEATRTEAGFAYPLVTQGMSVHDIVGTNFSGQNHFVSTPYTENVWVRNCNVKNPLLSTAQIGNYFADMSAGCINALVENNYAVGFTGGAKAETHTGAGVASNEDRPSQNVIFFNNTFEQCGDPITLIFPGAGGGAFSGIKLNGINHKALHNTITGRTTNVSTGGMYQGVYLTSTAVTPVETKLVAHDNDIKSTVIGINHDSPADTLHRFACDITNNKVRDTFIPATPVSSNDGTGIIASRNALVRGNDIYRTARSAILLQTPDQTFVRENYAYDCSSTNNPTAAAKVVYAQAGSGSVGYFEFVDNVISDSRGASSAAYGYFFEAGTTYTNSYQFWPGRTVGLLTGIAFDKYLSAQGRSYSISGSLTVPREFFATNSPSAIAPWNAIAWRVGDRAIFQTPTVGSPKAWVCTAAGTPGTWVSEGNL